MGKKRHRESETILSGKYCIEKAKINSKLVTEIKTLSLKHLNSYGMTNILLGFLCQLTLHLVNKFC